MANFLCKYCGKECKNNNSLTQHQIRCKLNPNKINTIVEGFNSKGRKAWNEGLTKETDARVAAGANTFKQNEALGLHVNWGHPFPEEAKQKQRENALKNGLGGFNMRRGIYYNGIKLDSSYEVLLAQDLDNNNIRWERPKRFPYHVDDLIHYYTPDFYLPDYDIYLDPKNDFLIENINPSLGYSDTDKINWVAEENNIKIFILNKNQLTWDYIKTLLI